MHTGDCAPESAGARRAIRQKRDDVFFSIFQAFFAGRMRIRRVARFVHIVQANSFWSSET